MFCSTPILPLWCTTSGIPTRPLLRNLFVLSYDDVALCSLVCFDIPSLVILMVDSPPCSIQHCLRTPFPSYIEHGSRRSCHADSFIAPPPSCCCSHNPLVCPPRLSGSLSPIERGRPLSLCSSGSVGVPFAFRLLHVCFYSLSPGQCHTPRSHLIGQKSLATHPYLIIVSSFCLCSGSVRSFSSTPHQFSFLISYAHKHIDSIYVRACMHTQSRHTLSHPLSFHTIITVTFNK
ncbi:hypothetical protein BDW22DRAFT_490208 [Trametopsis cervina]|nr:hypothetical protein BDW22DRAFT_490208 [Trametopsis cervina]